jgi:hypothetical protein
MSKHVLENELLDALVLKCWPGHLTDEAYCEWSVISMLCGLRWLAKGAPLARILKYAQQLTSDIPDPIAVLGSVSMNLCLHQFWVEISIASEQLYSNNCIRSIISEPVYLMDTMCNRNVLRTHHILTHTCLLLDDLCKLGIWMCSQKMTERNSGSMICKMETRPWNVFFSKWHHAYRPCASFNARHDLHVLV